jgi:hypothetical protein
MCADYATHKITYMQCAKFDLACQMVLDQEGWLALFVVDGK